jgi:nuclear transcription factor Y gamma
LTGTARDILNVYWQNQVTKLENDDHEFKTHQLPLARIKKVMKADPEVKMISAEAPILFAKGCDIFITELTMRAWIHAEENKRRTLQRSDIASALNKSDMFDFLIDIVPRDEAQASGKGKGGSAAQGNNPVAMHHGQVITQQNVQPGVPHPGHMGQHPGQEPYALDPHMGQPGIYAAPHQPGQVPVQQDGGQGGYPQHPQQMGEQFMYGGYAMPQQVGNRNGFRAPVFHSAVSVETVSAAVSAVVSGTRTRKNSTEAGDEVHLDDVLDPSLL